MAMLIAALEQLILMLCFKSKIKDWKESKSREQI
jgi:hypothetical protein